MMVPAIEISKVSFSYTNTDDKVLNEVSLTILEEEFIGLIGPNAGGKTTLVKMILGLLSPQVGEIKVLGQFPHRIRTRIGYVPQHPTINRCFPLTVCDAVLMGSISGNSFWGSHTAAQRKAANEIMEILDLLAIEDQLLSSLSSGQLQRVWIARALVSRPEILLLDEPTANIDTCAEAGIFSLLKQYNAHITILVVSHDIAFTSSYVTRVACLNQTLVCHDIESIDGKTIEELYGGHVSMIHHTHSYV